MNLQRMIRLAQTVLSPLPTSMLLPLVQRFPRLAIGFPSGRRLIFEHYLGDLRVAVDTTYPMERKLLSGEYERSTMAVIARYVPLGGVCLDIGANVGQISLFLARTVGATGHVYAFEPGPPTYARLCGNLALNSSLARQISAINQGVADQPGSLLWRENPRYPGNGGLRNDTGIPVPVETVDRWAEQCGLARLDFVKIDVEGMELEVLRGGRATWQRLHPALYFETLAPFRFRDGIDRFAAITDELQAIGYRFYQPRETGSPTLLNVDQWSNNTLALPA